MDRLKIFSGSAHPRLTEAICRYIGLDVASIEIGRFPDGETKIKVHADVRGDDCFVIQPTSFPANENLMELLIIIDALSRASAARITAVIPYYGYARQDRKHEGRVPITAKLVANLLVTAGVDRLICVDLHASQIQGFFDIPVDHLITSPLLLSRIKELGLDRIVVMSPDPGSIKRASAIAIALGTELALVDKRRISDDVVEKGYIVGDLDGKDAIIVDDMISTGGSLAQAIASARDHGARSVTAAATHAVFCGPAHQRLLQAAPDEVIVTDTVPVDPSFVEGVKLTVLSTASLIGEAIRRIHFNQSVSAIFREFQGSLFDGTS
ncbi:MAG: ribose-phosphate pyrophosphokinase [Planctomycetes bacterium]|nr:ribose-phosphate pyrophosphokinase [Planctomycetota bacterium]